MGDTATIPKCGWTNDAAVARVARDDWRQQKSQWLVRWRARRDALKLPWKATP